MSLRNAKSLRVLISMVFFFVMAAPVLCQAESAKEMEKEARKALQDLYASTSSAKVLGDQAKGILVFPSIAKGGFIVGGQYGEGVLFKNGAATGYYNTAAASFGLQAGLQKFGYALFFMSESDLKYLNKSDGWEVGVGPSITVVDTGLAGSFTTTTAREGVYAFFFDQKGLMAGLGIQGSKITKMDRKG
ncbi:MAG: twin-arginine translocation pathway signal protein [Proteobacteria bacterium]|nr:MAG: twin-arginine translocation pathway signal protein [Pseudomonadota bacterium]